MDKRQFRTIERKKADFVKSLEKDHSSILKKVKSENADKFQELSELEKNGSQSEVWQKFTIMALERLRQKPKSAEESKEPQSESAYFKRESSLLQDLSCQKLEDAKGTMIELLIMFLKQDSVFNNVAFWQKRAQFISFVKTKSILDRKDQDFY